MNSIILPPLEIQNVIEKTAAYVSKHGPLFEERIYEKERLNPVFSFLNSNDPYHPFYSLKIEDFTNGTNRAKALIPQQPAAIADSSAAAASVQPEQPEAAAPFKFYLLHPPLSPLDLSVMKITAQFTAKNGPSFASALLQREQKNFQFDFLRSTNCLFPFFSQLVSGYSEILRGGCQLALEKAQVLDLLLKRVEWEAWEQRAQQEVLAERPVDWSDFVVVETFEREEPPQSSDAVVVPPLTLQSIRNATQLERKRIFAPGEKVSAKAQPPAELDQLLLSKNLLQFGKLPEQQPDHSSKVVWDGTAVNANAVARAAQVQVVTDKLLVPEEQWLKLHPDARFTVAVVLSADSGQERRVSVDSCQPSDTISTLKERLVELLGIPVGKQKLWVSGRPPLRNAQTLASANIGKETVVSLGLKERGGEKAGAR